MSSDIEAFEAMVKNDYVVSLTDFLSELPNMKSKHDNQDLLQLIDQSVPPFRSIRDQVRDRLEEIDASGDMRAKAKSWKLRSHLLFLDRSLEKIEQVRRDCGGGGGSSSSIANRDSPQNEAEQIQHADGQQPPIANVAAAAAPQREEDTSHSGSRQDFPINEVHIKTGEGGVVSDASGNSGSPSDGFEDDTVAAPASINVSTSGVEAAAPSETSTRQIDDLVQDAHPFSAAPPETFGKTTGLIEGERYSSTMHLFNMNGHRCKRRAICGDDKNGAESIIVTSEHVSLREEDGLQWIKCTFARRHGGGALVTSFANKFPIRVFRSSNLKNKYAPPPGPKGRTSYRYDGLYRVLFMCDEYGDRVEEGPANIGAQYTFFLRRLPQKDPNTARKRRRRGKLHVEGNTMCAKELWEEICSSKKEPTQTAFISIQPTTYLKKLPLLGPKRKKRRIIN